MLTLTTPLLIFGAPPLEDNPSKEPVSQEEAQQATSYQESSFQEETDRREKRQGAVNLAPLPFQETLLLDNQYRPDQYQYRSTYRLVGEEGLVKVHRRKVVRRTKDKDNPDVSDATIANSVLPTQVLLGKVKVSPKSDPREREGLNQQDNWTDPKSVGRSQKQDKEPNLWTELEAEALPRGLQELQMVNHNLRPRVYFLPS